VLDAVGLGTYSVVGVAKALAAGLSVPAAVLVGVINACGGGLLRDVITREEPLLFKPGQFYAVASLLGCGVFVIITRCTTLGASRSALIAIGGTFVFRVWPLPSTGAPPPSSPGCPPRRRLRPRKDHPKLDPPNLRGPSGVPMAAR